MKEQRTWQAHQCQDLKVQAVWQGVWQGNLTVALPGRLLQGGCTKIMQLASVTSLQCSLAGHLCAAAATAKSRSVPLSF